MFIFSFFVWVASKNIAYGKNMFAIYFTTASTAIFVTTVGTTVTTLIFSAYSSGEIEMVELINLFNGRVRFHCRQVIFRGVVIFTIFMRDCMHVTLLLLLLLVLKSRLGYSIHFLVLVFNECAFVVHVLRVRSAGISHLHLLGLLHHFFTSTGVMTNTVECTVLARVITFFEVSVLVRMFIVVIVFVLPFVGLIVKIVVVVFPLIGLIF